MTEWIVTSSVLILIIAALRYLLRGRISLRLQYALWAVVLLRLLLPVQLGHSSLSVLNAVENNTWQQYTESYVDRIPDIVTPEQPSVPVLTPDAVTQPELPYDEDLAQSAAPVSPSTVLRAVWITGMAVTAVWLITANLRFAKMLRRSRRLTEHRCGKLPVYVSPLVATPCLFGLFRPNLYVTADVLRDETALRHALLHEETHYRHGDHVWSMLRGVCLALHWYNPLVWLAASLSRRDAELACDEGVLHRLGEEERTAYGETLIRLTCGHRPGELLLTATAMTGSQRSLRERIALIARRPKTAAYAFVAAILVVAVAAGCTFTGSRQPLDEEFTVSYLSATPVDAQVLSSAKTYVIVHAAILNELAGEADFITEASIHSVAVSPNGNTGNALCLYDVVYYFSCEDLPRLDELSTSGEFADKWQDEGTNGSAPVPNPFHTGFFRAEIIAPYSEPGVDEGRGTIPVTYKDSWQLPDAVIDSAAEFVEERADAIQMLVAAPDFITEGEITCLEPVDTASVSETLHIRLYYLDYRLRLRIPDAVSMSLDGMIYQEDDGSVWLVEPDTGSTRVLVMEYRVEEGRWSRVGLLDTRQIAEDYGGDYNRAAVEFYESVRSSVH